MIKIKKKLSVCGIQEVLPNTKIIGGVSAVMNSWPSMALILFKYTVIYDYNGIKVQSNPVMTYCGGTLIDRSTVITASHCYNHKVNVNLNGFKTSFPVIPNSIHPTIESAYTVYLGLHDLKEILTNNSDNVPQATAFGVHRFITVI